MINWILKEFYKLEPGELYDAMQLRSEVFVVEQNCVYLDADGKDRECYHLLGYSGKELAAYTRLVPAGVIYTEMSIGRVVTSPRHRTKGYGKELMQKSIETCYELFGNGPIKIGAQYYLEKFYGSLGFITSSGIYLEDGIEHIYMIKPPL
jgi:ElaA protein